MSHLHTYKNYHDPIVHLDEALLTLQEEFVEDDDLQDIFVEEKANSDDDYDWRLYGNY